MPNKYDGFIAQFERAVELMHMMGATNDAEYGRQRAVAAKFAEAGRLTEHYAGRLTACANGGGDWRREMLGIIRENVDDERRGRIDMLLNVLNMQEMMIMMREANGTWA